MQPTDTLFHRLGGSPGIASFVDDLVAAHLQNPTIKARFLPYLSDPKRVATIKQHTCRFLEAGSGGPASYQGRSMSDAHRGMNISAAEHLAALDDILLVLGNRKCDPLTQQEVLWIAYSLKSEIMHV